jgi:putative transposase
MKPISYSRHRFPPDVIRHAVWLYLRFTLSFGDVEDLLAEHGLIVSNESIRRWVIKFGPSIAKNLRAVRPRPHHRWRLDEMVVSIGGRQMYIWRAVDSEGGVLDILLQARRDKAAAWKFLRALLRRQGFVPTAIVTDKLKSYRAAIREIGFSGVHEQGLRMNKSSGKLTSAAAATRTEDAGLQVGQVGSTLRFSSCGGLQRVQRATALEQSFDASGLTGWSSINLEGGFDRGSMGQGFPTERWRRNRFCSVNVSKPYR